MKQRRGKLFILSGPSGTGKGTICKRLLELRDPESISLSVSMTTRQPRVGEVDGVNYYFTTVESFLERVEEGGLLEYAEVFGNYYGTPKAMVLEKLEQGVDVILEIDVQGALQVKKAYPEGVLLFILPPSLQELRRRITDRGTDAADVIDRRMAEAFHEIEVLTEYDYFVINDDLEQAIAETNAILDAEHARVTKEINALIERYKGEI